MSLAILFHFLCAKHVSDINISIIRSLRLFLLNYDSGHIVLGSVCVGVSVWSGWSGIHGAACNAHRTKNNMTNVVIQHKKSQAPDDGYINVQNMLST